MLPARLSPAPKVEVKQTGGGSFVTKTNAQGQYVVPSVTAAEYTIIASAPTFATAEKKILVGQLATVDLLLPVASTSAVVVVESANDLAIDTTSSQVAGNVTPSEVEDIPVNGRNYVELSALVPGIKSNSFGNSPGSSGDTSNTGATENGKFQITFDGLQFSQDSVASGFGQPHISQDAISQFQIVTNRFDATSGRSAGSMSTFNPRPALTPYTAGPLDTSATRPSMQPIRLRRRYSRSPMSSMAARSAERSRGTSFGISAPTKASTAPIPLPKALM